GHWPLGLHSQLTRSEPGGGGKGVPGRVYGPAESLSAVSDDACPLLASLLDGCHACIAACGQTASGGASPCWAHLLGPFSPLPLRPSSSSDHLLLRVSPRPSSRLISENPSRSPELPASAVEVYNNHILDLLTEDGCGVTSGVKRQVLTTSDGTKEVSGSVRSAEELMALVGAGLQLRAKQATAVHSDSSRSQLVVTGTLTRAASPPKPAPQPPPHPREPYPPAGRGARTPRASQPPSRFSDSSVAKNVCQPTDLRGAGCLASPGVSGAAGPALRETSFISRSLAALAAVLGALAEGRGHVPRRNSGLTRLLQGALGGDVKLQVTLCVSPGWKHVAETLQSLRFGARVRQVERGRPAPRKRR
uniref:Kinesin motor domain-containing protein n=1 Tax=Catagonus wagneri TaxID=51154 RepID=A0A8C3WL29_9CETA